MCGIVGIVTLGKLDEDDLIYFTKMLEKCVSLGRDATGMYNSRMEYLKAPEPSPVFLNRNEAQQFIVNSLGLHYIVGHCRAATRGSPSNNNNNHPLTDKNGRFLLVHNGMVSCDKWDFDEKATDTYIIVNAISNFLVDDDMPLYMAVNRGQEEIMDCEKDYDDYNKHEYDYLMAGGKWSKFKFKPKISKSYYCMPQSSMIIVGNERQLVLSRSDGYTSVNVRKMEKKNTYAFATTNYILETSYSDKNVAEIKRETSIVFDFEYEMACELKIRKK